MELVCDKQCLCAFENTDRTLIDDNGFIPICKVVLQINTGIKIRLNFGGDTYECHDRCSNEMSLLLVQTP